MNHTEAEKSPLNTLHSGLIIANRYILRKRIAMGGMGEVWEAQDENLNKRVAIKVLRPELAGQKLFLSRLEIESRNARQARHPNLAHIFNSGEQDGLGWIAMELVVGEPLTTILEKHPIVEPKFILSVLYQTCGALAAVHQSGIIHRDIKPGNILITKEGIVKLSDFGISKATNQITLTAEGMVMGTAQYLSPEQAIGKPASAAGDLYALGVITYEALLGKRPFTGERPVDIAFAHVNSPIPVLPSSIPEPLQRLIRNLLKKDPQERPHNAALLQKEIVKIWHAITNTPYHEWAEPTIHPVPPPTITPISSQNNRAAAPSPTEKAPAQASLIKPRPAEITLPPAFPPKAALKRKRLAQRQHHQAGSYSQPMQPAPDALKPPAEPRIEVSDYYPPSSTAGKSPLLASNTGQAEQKSLSARLETWLYQPRHGKPEKINWFYWVMVGLLVLICEFLLFSYCGIAAEQAMSNTDNFYSVWVTNLQIE